jgi:hypothetical protein
MVVKPGLVSAAVATLLLGLSLDASEPKQTDARSDGFLGPIRSVSTREEKVSIEWHQPDGPAVARPVLCRECEYDQEGNRVKSGQILDGEFRGEVFRILRDSAGNVIERRAENIQGEVYRRDVIGPYGITEQDIFEHDKLVSQSTWFYDENGHPSGFQGYDGDGIVRASSLSIVDASGNFKEQWDYGPKGIFSLHFLQRYEPKTDTFTFTSLNEDGSIRVEFTRVGTRVVSYRQEPSEHPVFGRTFFTDPVGNTLEGYSCHSDGSCDHIVTTFTDVSRRDATRVEWHDPAGRLMLAADYEYELDQIGNWLKRTVWVWSPELKERKLYETDHRKLKYWERE